MNLSDLKYGMVVQLRNTDLCLLEPRDNTHKPLCNIHNTRLRELKFAYYVNDLDGYKNDLTTLPDDGIYEIVAKEFDIMKVYKDYTLKKLLWERPIITIKDCEMKLLRFYKSMGYNFIARNADGKLWAYSEKPVRIGKMPYYLFTFITCADKEPTDINKLLAETKTNE